MADNPWPDQHRREECRFIMSQYTNNNYTLRGLINIQQSGQRSKYYLDTVKTKISCIYDYLSALESGEDLQKTLRSSLNEAFATIQSFAEVVKVSNFKVY